MTTSDRRPVAREIVLVGLIAAATVLILQSTLEQPPPMVADTARYAEYVIGLSEHATFGLRDHKTDEWTPGRANAPLYPAIAAIVARLSPEFTEALNCAGRTRSLECPSPGTALQLMHAPMLVGLLVIVWLLALRLGFSRPVAWTAMALTLLSGRPLFYADLLLTENLTMPLFALLLLTVVGAATAASRPTFWCWLAGSGAVLGLLTLTRPEHAYLAYCGFGLLMLVAALRRRAELIYAALLFALAFVLVLTPWGARNLVHFGDPRITTGYAGAVLAQRVAYNRMSWTQWGVAFVYWFPDFGDSLARRWFAPELYQQLSFGPKGFDKIGAREVWPQARVIAAGDDGDAVKYMLREEVLAHPLKHAAVSVALAWRGIFVAKLWGAAGLVCLLLTLFIVCPLRRRLIYLCILPSATLVAFYALVSVSIARYNLHLLPLFAISIAFTAAHILQLLRQTPQLRRLTTGKS